MIIISSIVWTGLLVAGVAVTSAVAGGVFSFLFFRKNQSKAAVLNGTITGLTKP